MILKGNTETQTQLFFNKKAGDNHRL